MSGIIAAIAVVETIVFKVFISIVVFWRLRGVVVGVISIVTSTVIFIRIAIAARVAIIEAVISSAVVISII